MVWLRARLFPELHTETQRAIQSHTHKTHTRRLHIHIYKTQCRYIHTNTHTSVHGLMHNATFIHIVSQTYSEIIRPTVPVVTVVKLYENIFVAKYQKFHLKTSTQWCLKLNTHTQRQSHEWRHRQDANTCYSITYHWVYTNTRQLHTHAHKPSVNNRTYTHMPTHLGTLQGHGCSLIPTCLPNLTEYHSSFFFC